MSYAGVLYMHIYTHRCQWLCTCSMCKGLNHISRRRAWYLCMHTYLHTYIYRCRSRFDHIRERSSRGRNHISRRRACLFWLASQRQGTFDVWWRPFFRTCPRRRLEYDSAVTWKSVAVFGRLVWVCDICVSYSMTAIWMCHSTIVLLLVSVSCSVWQVSVRVWCVWYALTHFMCLFCCVEGAVFICMFVSKDMHIYVTNTLHTYMWRPYRAQHSSPTFIFIFQARTRTYIYTDIYNIYRTYRPQHSSSICRGISFFMAKSENEICTYIHIYIHIHIQDLSASAFQLHL